MNSPALTNILLGVIAFFILILIVQTAMGPSSNYSRPGPQAYGPSSAGSPHSGPTRNPTVSPDAVPHMGNEMYYQAMSGFPEGCDAQKPLLECNSPAAQSVKQDVDAQVRKGWGPRQVFDYVVEKYGINALTQEAQRIRGARVAPQ
jgi:hypothetical protein